MSPTAGGLLRPTFGERLAGAVGRFGPLCAGIDPAPGLLADWGLPDTPEGLARFADTCVEAFAGRVAVVKPQVAFFERHGSAGLGALEGLIGSARAAGLLVLADAKRGDIGSTTAGYAEAWLGDGPLGADAMTAVAYLGLGALDPLVAAARAAGRGLFVVVRSSNPEGRALQSATVAGGRTVAQALLGELAAANAADRAASGAPLGALGAVVGVSPGANGPDENRLDLGALGGPVLVPGVGAQGGSADEVAGLAAGCPPGSVVVNESRSLLAHGPGHQALAAAAARAQEVLARSLA